MRASPNGRVLHPSGARPRQFGHTRNNPSFRTITPEHPQIVDSTPNPLISIDTVVQFEQLLQDSHRAPVVIFKHSATCGTSAQAFDEVEDFLRATPDARVHIVDVWGGRPLARHIAQALNVRHESPQLLVLANGQVVWHASHFRANAENLQKALERLAVPNV